MHCGQGKVQGEASLSAYFPLNLRTQAPALTLRRRLKNTKVPNTKKGRGALFKKRGRGREKSVCVCVCQGNASGLGMP